MGYNEHCIYQDCAGHCCNYYGDCPDWYSNTNTLYTECYYYYGTDTTMLLACSVASIIGVILLAIVLYLCYKYYRQEAALLKTNNHSQSAGSSTYQFQTEPPALPSPPRSQAPTRLGQTDYEYRERSTSKIYPLQ